jgi:transcription elongation factor Elf1
VSIQTFECPKCGHRLEKIIRNSENAITVTRVYCPECIARLQLEEMKQVLSVPSPAIWNCSKGSL